MAKVFYVLLTFLESGLAVFGIRSPFEQAHYEVAARLGDRVEMRRYGPLVTVETTAQGHDDDAFSRLFRYISGANIGERRIAMTTPVQMRGGPGATTFAQAKDGMTMRFVLPSGVAADPPTPTEPRVKIVHVPATTYAVIAFSGRLNQGSIARETQALEAVLARTGRKAEGEPLVLGYDPPFTIPFLRRNEIAIPVAG